jgi:hypothetical protein
MELGETVAQRCNVQSMCFQTVVSIENLQTNVGGVILSKGHALETAWN